MREELRRLGIDTDEDCHHTNRCREKISDINVLVVEKRQRECEKTRQKRATHSTLKE